MCFFSNFPHFITFGLIVDSDRLHLLPRDIIVYIYKVYDWYKKEI